MTRVSKLGRRPPRVTRNRYITTLCLMLWMMTITVSSQAVQQSPDTRWSQIKASLIGSDRHIRDGADIVGLTTPKRALDAAVVPVDISTKFTQTAERHISKLYLVIDNNPSPVAAVFEFPGDRNWETISTRVRVNAYTDVRVVAELNTGETYMTTNFVKASGGCSAPALKDPAAAAAQMGRMKLIVPDDGVDDLLLTRLMVRHPNSSGLQFDQITRNFIPADFVRSIEVSYNDAPLFKVATDISISENPTIAFGFAPDEGGGKLDVQVLDSQGRKFDKNFPLVTVQ